MLGSLRLVLLSGDWMPLSLPERLRAASSAKLVSLGGATEASIWWIFYAIGAVDKQWGSIPYGTAMRHQTVSVLNGRLESSPVWVSGDLYIGGIGVALGYWRDDETTQRSFLAHPRTGERLYRTGDMGRLTGDGNIEFLGRRDFQVKIHGHRVELGEIEHALLQHAGVVEAVVTAQGERFDGKRLVAYVCCREVVEFKNAAVGGVQWSLAAAALDESLRACLKQRLPE